MTKKIRIINEGLTLYKENELGAVYIDEKGLSAKAYTGKRSKSTWYYKFNTLERMHEKIKEFFDELQERKDYYAENTRKWKEKETARMDALKVGDMLACSWGWEQTNIDFYQVIAKGKKSFTMQAIRGDRDYYNDMCGEVTPVKDSFIEDEKPIKKLNFNMQFGHLSEILAGEKRNWSSYA